MALESSANYFCQFRPVFRARMCICRWKYHITRHLHLINIFIHSNIQLLNEYKAHVRLIPCNLNNDCLINDLFLKKNIHKQNLHRSGSETETYRKYEWKIIMLMDFHFSFPQRERGHNWIRLPVNVYPYFQVVHFKFTSSTSVWKGEI